MKTRKLMTLSLQSTHWCYIALVLIIPVSTLVQDLPWVFGLLSLPLIIFARGLRRGNTRTLIWMCFVTLLYFCIATDKVFGVNAHPLDLAELMVTILLFLSAMTYARCSQKMESLLRDVHDEKNNSV
ncbi:MAG: hypothetical protein CBC09_02685 [Cellvibrionales bacterium TMED49]|nr:hypothetical protein [Porticoccaceae bacterium]OUU39300.1 MAG: hypothetical protein CBC09_02685 [Cellvibrionales bacterium TMED49]|tara:strand:- start:696 stop:1076 length:381 start_codon:yes stop_codon:yes gene_type:complete